MGRRGLSPWYAALALLGAVMLTALLYSLNEANLLPLLPSGRLWSKPQTQGWCIYLTEREDGSPGLSYQDPWGRQWMKATWETSAWGSDPVRHTTEYRSAGAVQRVCTFGPVYLPDDAPRPPAYSLQITDYIAQGKPAESREFRIVPDEGTIRENRLGSVVVSDWQASGFALYRSTMGRDLRVEWDPHAHPRFGRPAEAAASEAESAPRGWGVFDRDAVGRCTGYTRCDPDGTAVLSERWGWEDGSYYGWTEHTLSVPGEGIELTERRSFNGDGRLTSIVRSLNGVTFSVEEREWDGNRCLGSRQRQQPGVAFSETRNEAGDPERLTVVQVGKTGFTLRYEYRNGYLWMVNGEGRLS